MRQCVSSLTITFLGALFIPFTLTGEPQSGGTGSPPFQSSVTGYQNSGPVDPELAERMKHLGLIVPEEVKERFEILNRLPPPPLHNTRSRFDWRELGGVTPVKDQENCGSCWDFAATAAFESAVLINDGVEMDLSEQQALSCNWGGSDCDGGWMDRAYEVYIEYGAVEESCMPYEADDEVPCYQPECPVVVMLDSVIDIQNNINAIKNALQEGPVSTTFQVYSDFHWDCYWHEPEEQVNHAVTIVGWDDDICRTGGWIIKNSWGIMWGDQGYFYLPYRSCNIGSNSQLPFYGGPPALTIDFPEGLPDFIDPDGSTTVRVEVSPGSSDPVPDTGVLSCNTGTGWQSFAMDVVSPNVYDAVFPAMECGSVVSFYFSAEAEDGRVVTEPRLAPSNSFRTYCYALHTPVFEDDFETDSGWTVENECTDGEWERAVPVGGDYRGAPRADYDGSGTCFLTDNEFGDSDVDSGSTALISPVFDLSGGDALVFSAVWFTNNYGSYPYSDYLRLWVTANDGEDWTLAKTFGAVSLDGWNRYSFRVGKYIDPTELVRIKFVAGDHGGDSVVEAGIDAVEVVMVGCEELPGVSVVIVPDEPPVIVPAGGSFRFTGTLTNNLAEPTTTDSWIMVRIPGYGMYGPVLQVNDLPFAAGQERVIQGIRQHIPRAAPPGDYDYIAYCGEFPGNPADSSSFVVTVTAAEVIGGSEDWLVEDDESR